MHFTQFYVVDINLIIHFLWRLFACLGQYRASLCGVYGGKMSLEEFLSERFGFPFFSIVSGIFHTLVSIISYGICVTLFDTTSSNNKIKIFPAKSCNL
jgi:hypothetical protein